jgi:phage gp46-like protein
MDEKNFAVAVNLIDQLAAAWGDESKQAAIRSQLHAMMREMTTEQLEAITQYEAQMVQQGEFSLERLKQQVHEAEAELKRRKLKK